MEESRDTKGDSKGETRGGRTAERQGHDTSTNRPLALLSLIVFSLSSRSLFSLSNPVSACLSSCLSLPNPVYLSLINPVSLSLSLCLSRQYSQQMSVPPPVSQNATSERIFLPQGRAENHRTGRHKTKRQRKKKKIFEKRGKSEGFSNPAFIEVAGLGSETFLCVRSAPCNLSTTTTRPTCHKRDLFWDSL